MKFKEFLSTKKGKIITGATVGGVVAIGIALAVFLQGNGYRSISVEEVTGTVNVVGEKNNGQAYKGQRLYSGDDVSVMEESELTMCMDNEKYVYADENTHFRLEASSAKESSRIKIIMDKGSELNVLNAKLDINESYEVDTPNSTMSVRGTTFRVTVYMGNDGLVYTLLEVSEGRVLCRLKTRTGEYNGVEKEFGPGESALIRGNDEFSEFVVGEKGEEVRILDYDHLPKENVPRLIALLRKSGIEITDPEYPDEGVTEDGGADKDAAKPTPTPTPQSDESLKGGSSVTATPTTEVEGISKADAKATVAAANKLTPAAKATPTVAPTPTPTPTPKPTPVPMPTPEPTTAPAPTTHTHSYSWSTTTEATCARDGVETGVCSCGDTKTRSIPATGAHKAGGWEVETAASCSSEGTEVQKCSECGTVMNTRSIAKTEHTWENEISNPDCTNDGYDRRVCTVCGLVEGQKPIPKLGHNWEVDKSVATHVSYVCSRCGETSDTGSD